VTQRADRAQREGLALRLPAEPGTRLVQVELTPEGALPAFIWFASCPRSSLVKFSADNGNPRANRQLIMAVIQAGRASALAFEPLTSDDPAEIAGYRLRARLGAGGMGRVYLAFTPGGRPVALKVMRSELGDDQDFRNRFRQEVDAARRVHGLYTAQVLDADPSAAPPWLVTAYVPGPSLQQAVAEHGPMPAETVFLLVAGIAEALAAIHAVGVVHRDLKPSNVLLAQDGPRVIDFGIARAVEATAVTRSGMRVGSPQFMAPEQVLDLPVTPAIDVFALGSLAAYAILGRSPFGQGNEAALLYRVLHEPPDLGDCPAELRILIERCLAKEPAARPGPGEIVEACRARTAGRTVELGQSWLPSAMAAVVALHAAPALRATPPAATPPAATPPAATPPAATPPVVTSSPPADMRTGALTVEAGGPPHRGRWRVSRTTMIAGLAAALILAALTGTVALALRGSPDRHSGRALAAAGSSHRARGTDLHSTAGTSPSSSPTPSPTASSDLDSCLFGAWKPISEDVINHIDSQPVTFTGRGAAQTYTPGGRLIASYGQGTVYTATVSGNNWTEIVRGRETMDYQTLGGRLLVSRASIHGSLTLLENGAYNNSQPLSLNPGTERYICSGNSLREYVNSGALELTRRTP
jgi:Protein kinase domain